MGNATYDNLLDPHPVARGASKAATAATAQDASPTPLPMTYANELKLGTKIIVEAVGEITTSAAPPTFQWGLYYGTLGVGWLSAAITPTVSLTAAPWHFRWNGIVTAVGAVGSIYGSGLLDLPTGLDAWASARSVPVTAAARAVAVNTQAATLWGLQLTTSAATAGNSLITDVLNIQVLNQGKT